MSHHQACDIKLTISKSRSQLTMNNDIRITTAWCSKVGKQRHAERIMGILEDIKCADAKVFWRLECFENKTCNKFAQLRINNSLYGSFQGIGTRNIQLDIQMFTSILLKLTLIQNQYPILIHHRINLQSFYQEEEHDDATWLVQEDGLKSFVQQ